MCSVYTSQCTVPAEKDRCRKCDAEKVMRERKILEVHVDKGMKDGQKITFRGESNQVYLTIFLLLLLLLLLKMLKLVHAKLDLFEVTKYNTHTIYRYLSLPFSLSFTSFSSSLPRPPPSLVPSLPLPFPLSHLSFPTSLLPFPPILSLFLSAPLPSLLSFSLSLPSYFMPLSRNLVVKLEI